MARFARFALVAFLALMAAGRAHAAPSLDACQLVITSLPAVISGPGNYCLDQNFGLILELGAAVEIDADNVVLDCHGHTIDNDTASSANTASGIRAVDRRNIVVRGCRVDGFLVGIEMTTSTGVGGGHLIEGNRAVNSRNLGISLRGDGSIARGNRVFNTGGSTFVANLEAIGIYAIGGVDVLDNTVTTALPAGTAGGVGIMVIDNPGGTVAGNRVRDIHNGANGLALGIQTINNGRVSLHDNDVVGAPNTDSIALYCSNANARARDNSLSGWDSPFVNCTNSSRNVVKP